MAEKQSSNPDLTKQIFSIDANIKSIFDARKNIIAKLNKADKAGNFALARELADESVILSRALDRQETEYDLLKEKEAKPEQERTSKLGEELRQPFISAPPRDSSPYGLMPGAPYSLLNLNVPSRQEQIERKRDLVGQIYNSPVKEGGMAAEQLPAGVRAGIGALPTPESELEFIKREYPNANITPINYAGKTEYLIKNKDGTSFTTFDKGVAGMAGMISVEAPINLLETGAALGTLAVTKSPITSTIVGAGTRAVLAPVADSIARMALKMPQEIGENISRRGMEAGIGMALGLGIDVIPSSIVAARMPGKFRNNFLEQYQQSVKRLGLPKTAVPPGAQFGPQGLASAQELAGTYSRTNIAASMRLAQEGIRSLFEDIRKGIPLTANDFRAIAVNQKGQRDAFKNIIARLNNKSSEIIDEAISGLLKPKSKTNVDDLGKFIRTTIQSAEDQSVKETNKQYDVLADLANQAQFNIEAKDLINSLPVIKAAINPGGAFDQSAVNVVEQRLMRVRDAPVLIFEEQQKLKSVQKSLDALVKERTSGNEITKGRLNQIKINELRYQGQIQNLNNEIKELTKINGPLDFRAFDGYIRAFNDARPDNAVGGSTKDVFGAGISARLSEMRRNVFSKVNVALPNGTTANLGDEFAKATMKVQERAAFEKNTLGTILKESGGEQATTDRAIVSAAMKEPGTINRVLQAVKELEISDPAQAGVTNRVQGMMRLQYLNDLGLGNKRGVVSLNYDEGMLDSLYGNKAAAAARGLDSLNEKLKALKFANLPEMTLTDLNALSSALSKDQRDKIAENIIKRNLLEQQEQALVRSSVFKAAFKEGFKNIDSDLLSKTLLSKGSTIGQTKSTMAKLSQISLSARNLFKGDFLRNLLDEYPGGTPSSAAPYTPLFDMKRFIKDYESPTGVSQLAQKIEIVLGKKDAQFLYDMAKVYEGNAITDNAAKGVNARLLGSPRGGSFVIPITPILAAGKNRYLAAMLSTGSERYGLKAALARNSLPGEVNDAYAKMFKGVFLTREGLTALSHQASSDPEFSAELRRAAKEFEEKEGLDLKAE